ncbi:putative metallopeptidase [Paenibacillus sp. GYB004]|uniref:putative metallopeptidase n=1 Tax=Paenibacillus sp. GYB004 TaxID=2994393 RepID=UPI002F96B303
MARAPKKEKFFSHAPEEVVALLDEVVEANHNHLKDTEFLVLMRHGGWQSKGKHVFVKSKVIGADMRLTLAKDAAIHLNADMWAAMSKPQRKYIIDHALYALDTATTKDGDVKTAADGRPVLTTATYDIEAYVDVVKRHGIIMEDVKRLAKAMTEGKQLTLDEALRFEANEKAADQFREKVKEAETEGDSPQDQRTSDDVDPDSVEPEERYGEELSVTGDDDDPMRGVDDDGQIPEMTHPDDSLPF